MTKENRKRFSNKKTPERPSINDLVDHNLAFLPEN
jgi:hypothetical protein